MSIERDLLYKDNKYANSNKLLLDKKYIMKKRIQTLLNVILFFSIIAGGIFLITASSDPVAYIDKEKYIISYGTKNIDIGNKILFSHKQEIEFTDKVKLYLRIGDSGEIGKVLTLSHGINLYTGLQVKQDKILVECLTSGCKGNVQEIPIKSVFGTVKE